LTQSNEANKYSRVATIRSLGRNYIAQHRFKEALDLANKALAIVKDARKLKIII
jgi:Flp pilus assembly protein TadD